LSPAFVGSVAGTVVAFVLVAWAYLPRPAEPGSPAAHALRLGDEGVTALLAFASAVVLSCLAAHLVSAVRKTIPRLLLVVLTLFLAVLPGSFPVSYFIHYDMPDEVWVITASQYLWAPLMAVAVSIAAALLRLRRFAQQRFRTSQSRAEA